MNGLTPSEIARMRGVPESAIRIRLMRARRAARQRIEQVGRNASSAEETGGLGQRIRDWLALQRSPARLLLEAGSGRQRHISLL